MARTGPDPCRARYERHGAGHPVSERCARAARVAAELDLVHRAPRRRRAAPDRRSGRHARAAAPAAHPRALPERPMSRRGFALLAALCLLVALSVASLALRVTTRTRRLAAANLSEPVRAAAAARAGVEQLRGRLVRRLAAPTSAPPHPSRGAESVFADTLAVRDAP